MLVSAALGLAAPADTAPAQASVSAPAGVELGLSYYGPYFVQPGVKLGARVPLRTWASRRTTDSGSPRKLRTLFVTPQLGLFARPAQHFDLLANVKLGYRALRPAHGLYLAPSLGFAYYAAFKVFLEFADAFYPDITLVGGGPLSALGQERIYYNAAFRKPSSRNILGLFCVGSQASMYTSAASEQALIDMMLAELDEMFGGQASPSYQEHVIQNWTQAPFVGGSYATITVEDEASVREAMLAPLDAKVYFAGEAFDLEAASTVPGAMRSAYAAVERMLREA